MNIYKVTRTDDWGYDDFDSFVCYAVNAEMAKEFVPHNDTELSLDELTEKSADHWGDPSSTSAWTSDPLSVKVQYLGRSLSVQFPKLILSSFNAG